MIKSFSADYVIPVLALVGITTNVSLHLLGYSDLGNAAGLSMLLLGAAPILWEMVGQMWRKQFGVDLIGMVAIVTSIILGEYLAGTVILLMLSGGEALEGFAMSRARKELNQLLSGMPTVAHVKVDDHIVDQSVDSILVGQLIVVKPGEVIPLDGNVVAGTSMVDESALTGESIPVEVREWSQVLSGTINKNGLLEIKTSRASRDSQYQQLIKLVRQAEANKAPIVRLADRYTVVFTVITFLLAGLAWFLSAEPLRVLAVLVVATPCPLILATPIAIISGISKAAKRGIIVKNGGALEKLGQAKVLVFDKTGTVTLGTPAVETVVALSTTSQNDILKIAASLDQLSTHILARSLLQYAQSKKISLQYPTQYQEFFGDGVTGNLDKKYYFGKLSFLEKQRVEVSKHNQQQHDQSQLQGVISVYLADERQLLGAVLFADRVRPESKALFARLAQQSFKIMMVTGDRPEVAGHIAEQIGVKEVYSQFLPEQKLAKVKELQQNGLSPVVMIGDGINDAAALATADIGIAIGVKGSSAASEAGDIVIAVDNLERVEEVYFIAKRTLHIALQSIWIGLGLSIGLMVLAALGYIPPVTGALLQEVIDVLVIFNALRVLR